MGYKGIGVVKVIGLFHYTIIPLYLITYTLYLYFPIPK